MDQYKLNVDRLPAVIFHNGSVLYSPNVVEVAQAIGVHNSPSQDLYDVAIVGAGPAGLAAGVYGASEGCGRLLLSPSRWADKLDRARWYETIAVSHAV